MKQSCGILLILALMLFCCSFAVSESSVKSNLTLMVYLCGSNLESCDGAASYDLEEMMSADFDSDRVNLLVMIGGTNSWDLGFDPNKTSILEVLPNRQISVWNSMGPMDMGEAETLTTFIHFCTDKYPADDYALVLWNHGGGPVEGVCWDELYNMDFLSLPELTEALSAAEMTKKLKWIGFDACLMSSLEVGCALSPFAEYMIASQETEPAFGWNYSFLAGIENDVSGADTGRRIVDSFFEGMDDYNDDMTLSCLDLSKAKKAEEALSKYFASSSMSVTPETFAALSNIRANVTEFGKAVSSTGKDGYDLIDAIGLMRAFQAENKPVEDLLELLGEMVVYSRSNKIGAEGVSLYYPYVNKIEYTEKRRDEYVRLRFSEGYTNYIRSFGSILTGKPITEWGELSVMDAGLGEYQEHMFLLQLTPEQIENYASAKLLILHDLLTENTLEENCALIYTGEAEINANDVLSAEYTGKALYIEMEDGTLYGPVAFDLTQDGTSAYVRMVYLPKGVTDTDQFTHVLYYLEPEYVGEYPKVTRIRVWDSVTESFTNRIRFDESRYDSIHLIETGRILPESSVYGLLAPYDQWQDGPALIGGLDINLPNQWHFRWIDEPMTGKQLYAVFQLTDIQQNTFCTQPIPVQSDNRKNYFGIAELPKEENPISEMKVSVINSPLDKRAVFFITVDNIIEAGTDYSFSTITINGKRCSERSFMAKGHGKNMLQLTMLPEEFYGLDRIETVDMAVTITDETGKKSIPISFRFDNCDIGVLNHDIEPMAETEQNGVKMQLLSLSPHFGTGIQAEILITNERKNDLKPGYDLVINGISLDGSSLDPVLAGTSSLRSFEVTNSISVGGYDLETMEVDPFRYLTYISDHLLQHRDVWEISEIILYTETSEERDYTEKFALQLDKPWILRDGETYTYLNTSMIMKDLEDDILLPAKRVELAENNQYTVACEKILMGRNGIALGLELTNRTDYPLTVYARDPILNGEAAQIGDLFGIDEWEVAPNAVRIVSLVLLSNETGYPFTELESIGIIFESREQRDQRLQGAICTMRLRDPVSRGKRDAVWIQPDQVESVKTFMQDVDLSMQKNQTVESGEPKGTVKLLEADVLMPENAATMTRWIPANLSKEQTKRIEKGTMFLVRRVSDGASAEIISIHKMIRNESGEFGSRFAGFILCPKGHQDIPIFTLQDWPDSEHLNIVSILALSVYDSKTNLLQTIEDMTVVVDFTENLAKVSEQELSGDAGEMTKASIPPYYKVFPLESVDPLPPVLDWVTHTGIRLIDLDGEPVQFELRPITVEDDLSLIFSVKEKDGTEYSLPSFSYPVQ